MVGGGDAHTRRLMQHTVKLFLSARFERRVLHVFTCLEEGAGRKSFFEKNILLYAHVS